MSRTKVLGTVAVVVAAALGLAGCSGTSSGSAKKIKVVYIDSGNAAMTTYMDNVTREYKAAHPGISVDLEPIKATEADFYTKVALMNRSASTAPDVIWEDSFQVKADAAAGYIAPLDSYLAKWSDWSKFIAAGRAGGQGTNGKQYSVPIGTDTQGLWYNKAMLEKAGISMPWKPTSWADVIDAAKKVKATSPGVVPLNVYASKAGGEATSVRGMQTLLSGTSDALVKNGKWVTKSPGLKAALGFVSDVYSAGLGPSQEVTSDANYGDLPKAMLKAGTLAIDGDGSWISGDWGTGGSSPWPAWSSTLGVAAWPTEDGGGQGTTSMSGGWTFAMGAKSQAKQAAFDYITTATNKKNSLAYAVGQSNIPVRSDVASESAYTDSNPTAKFFSSLVSVTHFRPATTVYPQVSNQLAIAADAVSSGSASPSAAEAAYGSAVTTIVGADKTTTE